MAFSKVTLNGETLMDVTDDTVAANNMLYGTRGTAANGTTVTGAVVTTPVDSTLDTTSHNAIENAAVASALALKADSSSIPSATSDLTNDSGFISTETDPVFGASAAATITSSDITNWNNKASSDTKVTQTSSSSNLDLPIILRNNTESTSSTTEEVRFASAVTVQPSNGNLKATTFNGYALAAASAKSVDTSISAASSSANLPTSAAVASFVEGKGYLTSYTETDPTVPEWAKQSTKPTYTFSELTSHPTSISGYGITDAYTKTEVDGKVSGVLHYKGTKATVSALPSSGNTIGDVWHVTADGSEWAWDGTEWQELGTAVDLSGYVPTSRTINSKALSANISLTASDVGALPSSTTYVSSFNGDTGAITYTAPVTSVNGQTGAVTVTEDDHKWNDMSLAHQQGTNTGETSYVAGLGSSINSGVVASYYPITRTPTAHYIAKYDADAYLNSTTPSANDNSTKVATTAYVDAAVSSLAPVVAYTATLAAANWSNTTPSTYTYSNTNLTCGANGDVPPLITCTSNETEYSTITSASATPGTGITFTAPSAPAGAIGLVIIDYK